LSRGDLFGTDFYAIENGFAAPDPALLIHGLEDLLIPPFPGIDKKTISLGQYGGSQELRIQIKGGAGPEANSAEDAVDVSIDLLPFLFIYDILQG